MKFNDVCVRNEEIAALQYFTAKKDEKSGVIRADYFDVVLKSGVTMHIEGDDGIYAKAVEQTGIQ